MLAFIPMPHVVTVQKAEATVDDWGIAVEGTESKQYKCRISYNSKNESIYVASGELVRYTATILFDGFPDLDYNDFIVWTDEIGRVHRKQPLEINYKYDLSGNPVAMKVVV